MTTATRRQARTSRFWRLGAVVALACSLFSTASASASAIGSVADAHPQAFFSTNGRTDAVGWDNYSLALNGQRIMLYSGEFHTYRLPVPSLWPDILQKVKSTGMNAVSVYLHWGSINPTPGVIDFDSYRALEPLYQAAKDIGIWIVLRPGPYINAETTAGGIAHWVTSQVAGDLRTNATDYRASWQDYIQGVINETTPFQITNGGPVIAVQIDNEYFQNNITGEYFAELEAAYDASDMVVPHTYNDPGMGKNFVNGTGAVNIYGLDSYPQGFDCSNPQNWSPLPSNYHDYHESTNPNEVFYFPEFQGGSFDAWGPGAPGYAACRELTGPDFNSVFYRGLWAANAKMMSFYMLYGGTSWAGLPFPGVYTSYDYGSAIAENRTLTTKHAELKLQALFLRSSPAFYKTDWIGNSTAGVVDISNPVAFATLLRNPDTGAQFWVVRNDDSTSTAITDFNMTVTLSSGQVSIPQVASSITIGGRQSKVLLGDYAFGASSSLLYSTAQVMFAGIVGGRDVVVLYGDPSQQHEVSLALSGTANIQSNATGVTFTSSPTTNGQTIVAFNGAQGLITVFDSDSQLVLFADTVTATTLWAPQLVTDSTAPLANFWQLGTNDTLLVGGPYLVRNASLSSDGSTLDLRGDLNQTVTLTVVGPSNLTAVTWNGVPITNYGTAASSVTSQGGFVGQLSLSDASQSITVPTLSGWKFMDSLPEIQPGFDDLNWIVANHTTTVIPLKPEYGDGRVLYGCDYGFCENNVLWRGHFNGTDSITSMNLSINGGEAFAASVWVNNVFLNTSFGNSTNDANSIDEVDAVFTFPTGSIAIGQDNVVTVVQDNMGLDESGDTTNTIKSARGIRGFSLNNGTFGDWKVQGKIGGYTAFPDKTRGVMNEGGLFAERQGWHLPGFDTSDWESRDLSTGLPNNTAGIGFFVTTFDLNVPSGVDVPMSFNFNLDGLPYRVLLFVNGWKMGKFVSNLGPQTKFPVHEGILDYNGTNTVAVALWAMESVAISPQLTLEADAILDGGVGGVMTNNPPFSSEGRC